MKKLLTRTAYEAAITGEKGSGIVDAYLTKWGVVDDYNTTFRRGSFKKTFAERGGKIRFISEHNKTKVLGKVIDVLEDDYGPKVSCQCNLETVAGKEIFAHLRAGDYDSFSFGFLPIQEQLQASGVLEYTEVKVMEVGPTSFPANEQAIVTDVRSSEQSVIIGALIEENFERRSSFTSDELQILLRGELLPFESRSKLAEMPDEVQEFHRTLSLKKIETLCEELRQAGLSDDEKIKFRSLLDIESTKPTPNETKEPDFTNLFKTLGI